MGGSGSSALFDAAVESGPLLRQNFERKEALRNRLVQSRNPGPLDRL